MEFIDLVKERYSCKNFANLALDRDDLERVLEAGRLATTAKNNQPQRIYVAESKKALAIIDEHTPCRYGAPTVLVVAFDKDNIFTYPGNKYDSGVEDATIVATHMVLAAAYEGVDSCWINFFDPDKLAKDLDLPENEQIVCLIDLGYANGDGKPLANHTKRKDLSETFKFI